MDLTELVERLRVQYGAAGDDGEGWEAADDSKLRMASGATRIVYGAPVTVVWDDSWDDDPDAESEDYGYIMGLPGHEESDAEMGAVVHIPEPAGAKEVGDAVWITLTDLLALKDVKRVAIGGVSRATRLRGSESDG